MVEAPCSEDVPPDTETVRRICTEETAPLRLVYHEAWGELLGHFVRKVFEKLLLVTLFVTLGRRKSAMVVRQRGFLGSSEGVRTTVGSTAGKPGARMASRFAYADGASGIAVSSRNQ